MTLQFFKGFNIDNVEIYRKRLDKEGLLVITDCTSEHALEELISKLGVCRSHNKTGAVAWDIAYKPDASVDGARSHTMEEFLAHTDASFEISPPKYIGVYVVKEDSLGGGVSKIISFDNVLALLSEEDKIILKTKTFKIRVPMEFRKNEEFIYGKLLEINFSRYRRDCILDDDAVLDRFDAAILKAKQVDFFMKTNTLCIFNNWTVLHARTKIFDPTRHLKRIRFD
jgi:alpha-ketoglutarate-dependent taurine dioxygenase